MAAQQLTIAFVGCGNISTYHLDAIAAADPVRCRVTALIDPDTGRAEKLAAQVTERGLCGGGGRASLVAPPRIFASLQEACAADPEGTLFAACDVMVPSWETAEGDLHEIVGTQVLRARRHLLMEKPLAASAGACERLIAAHAQYCPDKVFMVAENAQYWPEVVRARQLIESGAIGDLLTARAKAWESAMGEWAADYRPGSWRCDGSKLPAASFTFDACTHWIRPLRMWMGEVTSVAGVMGKALSHMAGASMSQHVFKFASGRSAIFETMLAPTAIADQPFFHVQGTRGEIVIDGFDGGLRLYTVEGERTVCKEVCKLGWDAGYRAEYCNFAAAVLDGMPLAAGAESAAADVRVALAMVQADEVEAWVPVPSGPAPAGTVTVTGPAAKV